MDITLTRGNNMHSSDITELIRQNQDMWELYTKKEEYTPDFLDKNERFAHYMSRHRNVMEPVVSKYLVEKGFKTQYPDNKKFAVCLTHDIDYVFRSVKGCLRICLGTGVSGDFGQAMRIPFDALLKKDWNFRQIIELESQYDAKSTFFFLALKKGDWEYSFDIQKQAKVLKYISSRGWGVGLHGGHEAYHDLKFLKEEKARIEKALGKKVTGYRNHFLHFKTPDTWKLLSQAGFGYDSTFGYADCAGFRNGMCHPFKPFDLNENKEIDIWEIPLNFMDCTLLRDYMRLDVEKSWALIKRTLDTVERCNGVVTVIWHNNFMYGKYLDLYKRILDYSYDKNAWLCSADELYEWVKNEDTDR